MATTELINVDEITQPFDLAQALTYMKENGEYVRYIAGNYDLYMHIEHERKPVVINGKRQFKEFSKVVGISKFGGSILSLPIADFVDAKCYIMQFDEDGNPIWDLPETDAAE